MRINWPFSRQWKYALLRQCWAGAFTFRAEEDAGAVNHIVKTATESNEFIILYVPSF